MTIPLFDCRVGDRRQALVATALQSGALAAGPAIGRLEGRLSERLGGRPVVATSDLTHALVLALRLAGVRPGDRVATLAFNCLSSNSAITMAGAIPVWLDIDPVTITMDLDRLEAVLRDGVSAVVGYHVAGRLPDLTRILAMCRKTGTPFIEDANCALGGCWGGVSAGQFGDFAALSFYANRQLSGIDGGAVVTPDPTSAVEARNLRRFGIDATRFRDARGEIDPSVDVPRIGLSAALSNISAVLVDGHLEDFNDRVGRSVENARRMGAALAGVAGLRWVEDIPGAESAPWVGLVCSPHRDWIAEVLRAAGIGVSKLHQRNDVYSGFGAAEPTLPGTDLVEREMIAVPVGWWLDQADIDRVASAITSAVSAR